MLMSRAGKNASVFFENTGHSQIAKDLMHKKLLIGRLDVENRGRRYSVPEILASDWHEARRNAMLKGRHGEAIQEMMLDKDWHTAVIAAVCGIAHAAVAWAIG